MNTADTRVQEASVVREKPQKMGEAPRYAVDPSSPEFTDVLMRCFAEGKRQALAENEEWLRKHKP